VIDIFVGYDPREASAYHTFCDSVIRRTSLPVRFTPLYPNLLGVGQKDGSNSFNYSRFLVPFLKHYTGYAIFCDGDMICRADIVELWNLRDTHAVQVVKHDYRTRAAVKYLGNKNEDYPRKNWSSVMIFNCARCHVLTPEVIRDASGKYLHRFEWCEDGDIGALPAEWNHLVGEYAPSADAKLLHYTLGTPCFADYYRSDHADEWRREMAEAMRPLPVLR
jgi:hypothetical protein